MPWSLGKSTCPWDFPGKKMVGLLLDLGIPRWLFIFPNRETHYLWNLWGRCWDVLGLPDLHTFRVAGISVRNASRHNRRSFLWWELCCHLDHNIRGVVCFRWGGLMFNGLCTSYVIYTSYVMRRLLLFPAHVRHVTLETSETLIPAHIRLATLHTSVVVRSITTLWTIPKANLRNGSNKDKAEST